MLNPFRHRTPIDELDRLEKRRDGLIADRNRYDQIAADANRKSEDCAAIINSLSMAIVDLAIYADFKNSPLQLDDASEPLTISH